MELLDALVDNFLLSEHEPTKCRVCSRKLTDPISIYLGVGPECAHNEYDLRLPVSQLSVHSFSQSEWDADNDGPHGLEFNLTCKCPWCDGQTHHSNIVLWNEDWKSPEVTERYIMEKANNLMEDAIDAMAGVIRYQWSRGLAPDESGWPELIKEYYEDLGSWEPWIEIARQWAMADSGALMEYMYEELVELAKEDFTFNKPWMEFMDIDGPGCTCKDAPEPMFYEDWTNDEGYYCPKVTRNNLGKKKKAVMWLFGNY